MTEIDEIEVLNCVSDARYHSQLATKLEQLLAEIYQQDGQRILYDKWTILKSVAIAIGVTTGIPSIRIAKKLAGNNSILELLYPYSMLGSVASLSIWSLLDFIQLQKIRLKDQSERSTMQHIIQPATVGLMAILTTIPYIIISYRYNNSSLTIAVTSFICEAVLNISPFNRCYRLLESTFTQNSKRALALTSLRSLLTKRINKSIDVLINLSPEEQNKFLQHFFVAHLSNNALENIDVPKFVAALINLGRIHHQPIQVSNGDSKGVVDKLIIALSFILPSAWAFIIVKVMIQEVSRELNSLSMGIFVALVTCLPTYMLEGILSRLLNYKFLESLSDIRSGNYYKNISQQYYLISYLVITLLSLFTVSCSFAARAQITKDEISGIFLSILLPIVIFSTIFYKASAILSLAPNLIECYARNFSDPSLRQLACLVGKLKEFLLVMTDASANQFEEFYNELHHEILENNKDDAELERIQREYENVLLTTDDNLEGTSTNCFFSCINKINIHSFWRHSQHKTQTSFIELQNSQVPLTDDKQGLKI